MRAAARARGAKLGRRPIKLNAGQQVMLEAWEATPTTMRDLASRLGLSVGKAHMLANSA